MFPMRHTHKLFIAEGPNFFGTRDRFYIKQFYYILETDMFFGMIEEHYIYCLLILLLKIDNEIIIQLAIMHNQWEFVFPELCTLV